MGRIRSSPAPPQPADDDGRLPSREGRAQTGGGKPSLRPSPDLEPVEGVVCRVRSDPGREAGQSGERLGPKAERCHFALPDDVMVPPLPRVEGGDRFLAHLHGATDAAVLQVGRAHDVLAPGDDPAGRPGEKLVPGVAVACPNRHHAMWQRFFRPARRSGRDCGRTFSPSNSMSYERSNESRTASSELGGVSGLPDPDHAGHVPTRITPSSQLGRPDVCATEAHEIAAVRCHGCCSRRRTYRIPFLHRGPRRFIRRSGDAGTLRHPRRLPESRP